jgi:hypothetical protein
MCYLLGVSPASGLYWPTFRNILSVPSSRQVIWKFVTYVLLLRDNILNMTTFICETLSLRIHKTVELTRRNSSCFLIAISSRIPRLSFYIVLGRFLYTHSFQCPHRKKSGTVRSGDRTGHGLPDIWKWLSSLVNTLHTPPIQCHWRGFEITWHLFFCVQSLRSEMCKSAPRHAGSNAAHGRRFRISLLTRM